MRAVLLKDFNAPSSLTVTDIPRPVLKRGQVLIRIAAAPINPSDLVFLRNQYGIKKSLPVVPGFEGSGIVVESKAGLYGRWLVGRRVGCHAPENGNGTWAEFMAADDDGVVPLLKDVTEEQGASLLVNPLTAWALLTEAKSFGHDSFIQTAAASALGRMINRLSRRWGLNAIHIVRRREQVELLKSEGAIHVLDTSLAGWKEQLTILSDRYQVRIAFDAVGGDLSALVAQAMVHKGRVIVYGALSGKNCQMSPSSLIFDNKSLEGFWVTKWIKKQPFLKKMLMLRLVQKCLRDDLATTVQGKFPLEKVQEALVLYKKNRTDGKVLLLP